MPKKKKNNPVSTPRRSLFTGEVVGRYDARGHLISNELSDKRAAVMAETNRTPEKRAASAAQITRLNQAGKTQTPGPLALTRREAQRQSKELLNEIAQEYGDDIKGFVGWAANLHKENGAQNMDKLAAGRVAADIVFMREKAAAQKQAANSGTNNVLITSEKQASDFFAAIAGRGSELVAVQSGPVGGAPELPGELSDGPVQRADDSQDGSGGDEVAQGDSGGGGEQPGEPGGTDAPPA